MDMSEIGVFRASDAEEAAAMLTAVEAYLSDTLEENRAFLASYAPQELAKLEAAQARCFGRYVVFCICDPEQTEACFESAEQALLA